MSYNLLVSANKFKVLLLFQVDSEQAMRQIQLYDEYIRCTFISLGPDLDSMPRKKPLLQYKPLYDNKGSGIAQLVERLHRDHTGLSLTGASLGLLPGLTVAGHSP